jgi:hypothetical protein
MTGPGQVRVMLRALGGVKGLVDWFQWGVVTGLLTFEFWRLVKFSERFKLDHLSISPFARRVEAFNFNKLLRITVRRWGSFRDDVLASYSDGWVIAEFCLLRVTVTLEGHIWDASRLEHLWHLTVKVMRFTVAESFFFRVLVPLKSIIFVAPASALLVSSEHPLVKGGMWITQVGLLHHSPGFTRAFAGSF